MEVRETTLPGVGKKFKMQLDRHSYLIIIVHNTGKRELYLDDDPESDNKKILELSDSQSRIIGSILEGSSYIVEDIETPSTQIDERSMIEWYTLEKGNKLVGRSLKDINADTEVDVQIIACRSDDTTTNSNPDNILCEGDIIITVGSKQQHMRFSKYLGE